jgi:SAM-dependent methyltransferase
MKHIKSFNESNLDDFVDISKQFLPNKSAHINIPTPDSVSIKMIKFVKSNSGLNQFLDLGSGNGDVLKSSSKYFDENFGIELSDKYIEYSLNNLGQSKNIKVIKGDLLSREIYKKIPQKPTFVYSYLPFTGRTSYNKSSNISEQSIRMNKMFDIVYDYFPSGSIFFFKSWSYKKNNEMNSINITIDLKVLDKSKNPSSLDFINTSCLDKRRNMKDTYDKLLFSLFGVNLKKDEEEERRRRYYKLFYYNLKKKKEIMVIFY